MVDAPSLLSAVAEFVEVIDELYGFYLDSTYGFHLGRQELIKTQEQARSRLPAGTDLDSLPFSYAVRQANDPATDVVKLRLTQGDFKRHNEEGGHNDRRAVQVVVVFLFEQWQSKYRREIATALGHSTPDDLKEPLFGDLRLLRNDIVHCRGVVGKETARKLSRVKNLSEADEVYFTDDNFGAVIRALIGALDLLVVDAGLPDPGHRNRWQPA